MAVEVRVQPCPLPLMRKGETRKIRITFKGGMPGEPAHIRILGATNTSDADRIQTVAHQAVTFEPAIDLVIRATKDGTPAIIVSSPKRRFEPVTVNGHPVLFNTLPVHGPNNNWIMFPTPPPPREEAQPQETTQMPDQPVNNSQQKSWLPFIAGFFIFIILACGGWWWWTQRTEPAPVVDITVTEPESPNPLPPTPSAEQVDEPAAEAPNASIAGHVADPPEETPEPEAAAPVAAPPVQTPTAPAATTTDPTGCTFINGNRPKVGEKYILRCDDGEYLATGTYVTDHFAWSDFEEHPEPK